MEQSGKRKFLMLLIENKSSSLRKILNSLYYFWDFDDLVFMISTLVRLTDGPDMCQHK